MTQTEKEQETLARRAFGVYDQDGERAMMSFITENRDERQDGTDRWERGIHQLKDGSQLLKIVRQWHCKGEQPRDAALEETEYPKTPMARAAVVPWPNSDTVRTRVMEEIAREAQEKFLGSPEGQKSEELAPEDIAELMDRYEIIVQAPGMDQAMALAMDEMGCEDQPEYVMETLEAYEESCARRTRLNLPQGEIDALELAIARKLGGMAPDPEGVSPGPANQGPENQAGAENGGREKT